MSSDAAASPRVGAVKYCTQCGHELGASRTCGRCGTIAAVEPPPAPALPTAGPRYPLYADEATEAVTTMTAVRSALPAVPVLPPRRRPTRLTWLTRLQAGAVWGAAGLVLVLVLAVAGWLLLADGSDRGSGTPTASAGSAGTAGEAVALAAYATAEASATSPDGVDLAGAPISFAAANVLDGDPSTAWRMPGDGTGAELTFSFAEPVTLSEVGLVNGYAKSDGPSGRRVDWYAANRRVLAVEWLFDDGSALTQQLTETRSLQTMSLDDVRTATVRLRLLAVSAPGRPVSRDATPISEVSLAGTTR